MRRGGKMLILLGVVLGLIAAAGVLFIVRAQPAPEIETQPVVVAVQNIPQYTEILAGQVEIREWPVELVPAEAVSDITEVVGMLALIEVFPGQIILEPMVLDKEAIKEKGSDASFLIPEGMVAVAFPISSVSGVAGAIEAGDTVDVLVSLEVIEYDAQGNESKPEYSAQLTLQDIEVLRVGPWVAEAKEGEAEGPRILTLLVSRQDALVVKYAQEKGAEVTLALRPAGDHEIFVTLPVDLDYMVERFNFARPPFIIQGGE